MSRNYKFHNPEAVYFVSFAVVEWINVFTRNEYKEIPGSGALLQSVPLPTMLVAFTFSELVGKVCLHGNFL